MTTSSDQKIDDTLMSLPELQPSISVWRQMEARAGNLEKKRRLKKNLQRISYGLAASLALGWAIQGVFLLQTEQNEPLHSTVDAAVRDSMPGARSAGMKMDSAHKIDALLVSTSRRAQMTINMPESVNRKRSKQHKENTAKTEQF